MFIESKDEKKFNDEIFEFFTTKRRHKMKKYFDTRVAEQLLKEQLACDYMPEKGGDLFNSNFIDPNFLEFQAVCGGGVII